MGCFGGLDQLKSQFNRLPILNLFHLFVTRFGVVIFEQDYRSAGLFLFEFWLLVVLEIEVAGLVELFYVYFHRFLILTLMRTFRQLPEVNFFLGQNL